MPTKANVSAGKPKISGAIYRAPIGTALPASATAALNAAFAPMGYISSDGLTNANNASTSNIRAWGGDVVLVVETEKTDTMAFTLIEALNADVLAAVHGSDNVAGSIGDGITITVNADLQEEAAWVIDMVLQGNTAKRIVVPDAVISAMADVVYKDDTAIGYGVTLTCIPDTAGNTHYEYIKGTATGSVALNNATASVAAGATTSLTATTTPSGGTVRWYSSAPAVATVAGGVVTGVAAGTAIITARVAETGAAAYCTVTVTA